MSREIIELSFLRKKISAVGIKPKTQIVLNRKLVVSFLIAGFACIGFQTTLSQTELNNLIIYSLKHSHDIKKSNLQCEEVKYQMNETIGKGLPQIEGTADYSKMFLSFDIPEAMYQMVGEEYQPMLDQIANMDALYMASISGQITQLIYSQSYWEGLKTVKKTKELYETLKEKTEEEVIEEVSINYYQLLALYQQLESIEKSIKNLSEMYRIVELNYENGLIVKTEVDRLKVNITNLEVAKRSIKNGIKLQLNYTKALAGMPRDTSFLIDTTSIDQILKLYTGSFNTFSTENVPAFRVLLKQNEIHKQQIKLSQAEYYPTLAAYGQLNYSSYNTESSIDKLHNMSTIGVQLKIPIFTSGANHAKVQQERVKQLSLQEDIEKNSTLLSINYDNAIIDYQSACNLLSVQEENRQLALSVYEQTSLQYKEGIASMADLLNVSTVFLQADNSYNQQLLKCKLSEIKVMKATGSLKQLIIQ